MHARYHALLNDKYTQPRKHYAYPYRSVRLSTATGGGGGVHKQPILWWEIGKHHVPRVSPSWFRLLCVHMHIS